MFSVIVVGTDGSAPAEAAVHAAGQLARGTGGEVHVVVGYEPVPPVKLAEIRRNLPEEFWDAYDPMPQVTAALERALEMLAGMEVTASGHQVGQDPTEALLTIADRCDADLVVVGSRGRGSLRSMLLGSVSTKLVHHCNRSVLIVHDREADQR